MTLVSIDILGWRTRVLAVILISLTACMFAQDSPQDKCSALIDNVVELDFRQFSINELPNGSFRSGSARIIQGISYCEFTLNSTEGKLALHTNAAKTVLDGDVIDVSASGLITDTRPYKIVIQPDKLTVKLSPATLPTIPVSGGLLKLSRHDISHHHDQVARTTTTIPQLMSDR